MPLGTAIALFSTLAHALIIMIMMLLLLPETRDRVIASLEPEALGGAAYPPRTAVERLRLRVPDYSCGRSYHTRPSLIVG